jgi:TATA-box binding protein (TBP) (component of TFIID and TFIIIB)
MLHLSSSHALNTQITTMTYETLLIPIEDEMYVTHSMLLNAATEIAKQTTVKRAFKNAFFLTLHVKSPRPDTKHRKVSVKVFKNLRLHITGTHSLEMAQGVVGVVQNWLSKYTKVALKEDVSARKVDVVLYKYRMPGEVNMCKVREVLEGSGILSIYDPTTYAGIRAKVPLRDGKLASVMIFRLGKIIMIIPHQADFDGALAFVTNKIEEVLVNQWQKIATNTSNQLNA